MSMQERMLIRMPSTSVRVDRETHEELKKLARELGTTVGEAVAIAIRRLRQQRIGKDLRASLTEDETSWLDADLG
jgi:antitoxin component of RelBE/YafQ-DinJ toxin-antitoxin module